MRKSLQSHQKGFLLFWIRAEITVLYISDINVYKYDHRKKKKRWDAFLKDLFSKKEIVFQKSLYYGIPTSYM